jgi:hypothetical protein
MNRSTFLQSLFVIPASIVAGGFLSKDEAALEEARKKYPHLNFDKPIKPIAIDINYLKLGGHQGSTPTPSQILEMYHETGILVWRSKPGDPPEFKPFTEI